MRKTAFNHRKPNEKRLHDYGFVLKNDINHFECPLANHSFRMIVDVHAHHLLSLLYDEESESEYTLVDVSNTNGAFINNVKAEYEMRLQAIFDTCFDDEIFQLAQSKTVIAYINKTYGDQLEFLWKKTSDSAIWRNQHNQKWYGILLFVSKRKLGMQEDDIVEVLDLRYQKDDISTIVDHHHIFPGYHMNKQHWISIPLDGSVHCDKIFALIDNSYQLSLKK